MKSVRLRLKVLVASGSCFVSCLAVEAAVRTYARAIGKQPISTYDAELGWAHRPNVTTTDDAGDVSYRVQINQNGLRDAAHTYSPSGSASRIVVLGDSFVFGYGGVEQHELFTEILEAKLGTTDVINMGVVGFSTDQEYLYLRREAVRYQPNLVIVALYENDFEPCFSSRAYGSPKGYFTRAGDSLEFHPPELSWFFKLSQDSWALRYLDRYLFFARSGSDTGFETIIDPGEREDVYRAILRSMNRFARSSGAAFMMLYIPERDRRGDDTVQRAASEVSDTDGIAFLDLGRDSDLADERLRRASYFRRDHHLNAEGHRVVADELHDFLTRTHPSLIMR